VACTTALAATLGYSGCLLGKSLVPDDVNLVPLTPPALIENFEINGPNPLPGTLTVFSASDPATYQTFSVRVIGGTNGDQLVARYFIDREYPQCQPRTAVSPTSTCDPADLPQPSPIRSRSSDGIPTPVTISLAIGRRYFSDASSDPAHACHVVDLFVSSDLQGVPDSPVGHLPTTEGDVLHVRWYVLNYTDSSVPETIPSADACLHRVSPH
jgi:hypothetical protein